MKMAALFGRKLAIFASTLLSHVSQVMFGVKIRRFEVREFIHVGFKLIQIIEIQDGRHICPKNFLKDQFH